jgi:predicted O-methyltransferase YrrM
MALFVCYKNTYENKEVIMIKPENLEVVNSTKEENQILERLDDCYIEFCEMTGEERRFLNSMILRRKPLKLLEIGVSAGGSSVLILNAIRENEEAKLSSIDYSNDWYKDPGNKVGFIADKYPELKEKWKLYSGALSLSFLDRIGNGIDFVFIDTMHINPGEILDFLMILPYLTENALVVFHDTKLYADLTETSRHSQNWGLFATTNNLLMSAIYGKKYIPLAEAGINIGFKKVNRNLPDVKGGIHFPNIGAITIDINTRNRIFEVFNLLTLQWAYMPSDNELVEIAEFLARHYDPLFISHFKEIIFLQKIYFSWFNKQMFSE